MGSSKVPFLFQDGTLRGEWPIGCVEIVAEPSVFISYNGADREIARGIANALIAAGMVVWIDEGELLIGDSLIEKIAFAIKDTDYLIAIISENSIQSHWCQKEIAMASTYGIMNRSVKVLPVRVGDVDVPPALIDLIYEPLILGKEQNSHSRLVRDITRHFYAPLSFAGSEPVESKVMTQLQDDVVAQISIDRRMNQISIEEQETQLIAEMDLAEESAVVVSLQPFVSTPRLITADSFERVRQRFFRARVIPPSPHASWMNVSVAKNRYILDGGSSGGGYKWCAAELQTDGSGVFIFLVRDASNASGGTSFVFDDESVVAAVLGGLALLGENAVNGADSSGPYSVRVKILPSDSHKGLIPGYSRGYGGARQVWDGARVSETSMSEVRDVSKDILFPPSDKFIKLAHHLLSEIFQTFGLVECPQIDEKGRVRIQYWSKEWQSEMRVWCDGHNIQITEDTL